MNIRIEQKIESSHIPPVMICVRHHLLAASHTRVGTDLYDSRTGAENSGITVREPEEPCVQHSVPFLSFTIFSFDTIDLALPWTSLRVK